MSNGGAPTGQEAAEPALPRLAATVVLLRDAAPGCEVLLVRRTPRARFMGGAWVFPGGAVDPGDGEGEAGLRAAAVREAAEEAGLRLPGGPDALVPFARWITPERLPIRFDTHFFLARAPAGQVPRPDGQEVVGACWLAPRAALAEHAAGQLELVLPTRMVLGQLAAFASSDALIAWARAHEVRPVLPRLEGEGETARIVLPGEG